MKSYDVVAFGEPLQPREKDAPQPKGTEVVLRVAAAGVCHSDLHMWEGYYDLGEGKRLNVVDRGVSPPFTMGHEVVGEVVALGYDAKNIAVGDVRLVYPWIGCGACPACKRGTENLCRKPNCIGIHRPGGYATHILVPHPRYLIDIAPLTPEEAAPFACSGLTAYGAIMKLGAQVHEAPVAIIGAGGVGLMAISLIKALGGAGAISVDISAQKREAALAAGARTAIDGNAPNAGEQLAAASPDGLMAVIDFVGSTSTANLALGALARGGTYIAVGLYGGTLKMPLPYIPMRALTIQGSYTGSLAQLEELMVLARRGDVPPLPVSPSRLSDVNNVLHNLHEGRVIGRAVVVP
jgi:D-arabinose 1-dehydrogenase-like Zn-dependent alcohol dehydrogenase